MKRKEKTIMKRLLSLVSATMLSVSMLCLFPTAFVHASERPELKNPVLQSNGIMAWDCVYFGNYPQSADGKGGFLNEPIKWRVLSVDGDDAYLMADKLLDCMPFCVADGNLNCLYEQSTIRCWLNGYDASENIRHMDYTSDNFIDKAFSKTEQDAIKVTRVINDESMEWAPYYDKNHFDTDDKIFLITRKELTTAAYMKYGFVTPYDEEDEEGFISEPTSRRAAYTTDYCAAGGSHGPQYAEYINAGGTRNSWNLRSPGEYPMYNGFINAQGEYNDIEVDSNMLNSPNHGTRPCLHLDLTKTDVYTYAGKAFAKDEDTISGTSNYSKKLSDPAFDLKLKQEGDGKITYTSSNPEVAEVDDNGIVTLTGLGNVEIKVVSAETDRYLSASKIVKIAVKKGVANITAENVTKTFGDEPFALGATAPTSLTYTSDNTNVCTVAEDGTVTIVAPGTAHIKLVSEGTGSYTSAEASVTITVSKKSQTIQVEETCVKTYGDEAFALGASAETSLTYKTDDENVCTVAEDGTVTIQNAGTAQITITAAADKFTLSDKKVVTITVNPADQTITAKNVTKTFGAKAFALGAKAKTAMTYKSDNAKVCTIAADGMVTIKGAGTSNITITAEAGNYNEAVKTVKITVNPATQTITAKNVTKTFGAKAFALGAKAKTAMTYQSSDAKVCTIAKDGKVTIKGAGKATITITAKAGNYAKAVKKVTITVKPGKVVLGSLKSSAKKTAVATWKKRAEATGYEVTYAANAKFNNAKTIKITKAGTLKTTIKNLKSGSKCYVKVRAYKKCANTTLRGSYSSVKIVSVK